ncbi:molybdenum cofactor cytidylyltransferase [Sphaerotilus sulfidivorans]|jgi:molybdenum cofactor cytidylyltransferase|uniref:Molybdenum cofactor cytidylyltransferase n=1 Tax=Sphaerotilus sulfidivorans TaxID=639200 RepID=A0A5C1PYH6_9BURK|nr:nucleotidyltransferase family protein [Sphaerotilus sulfidivorans]QEN00457.1 nucleotidyltransferase family protein [Sphaerotilus sulfidivorans]GIX51681.1 molybdopterin-guanine dinucleotide biosynthesis protein A [Sphaerotilus natans]
MSPARTLPTVVVLAAGAGRRFAGTTPKLASPLGRASVLAHTLEAVLGSGLPLVVVTVAPLVGLVREVVASRDIVLLPPVGSASREPLGAGYSIAAGVTARAQACGWLVLPGDMPRVRPQTLQLMARAVGQGAAPIACAQHLGRAGHPIGLAAEMYNELSRLSGDQGLRRLLARYPSFPVETGDPGVLIDIDTREDLERLIAAEPAFSVRQPVPLGQVDQA